MERTTQMAERSAQDDDRVPPPPGSERMAPPPVSDIEAPRSGAQTPSTREPTPVPPSQHEGDGSGGGGMGPSNLRPSQESRGVPDTAGAGRGNGNPGKRRAPSEPAADDGSGGSGSAGKRRTPTPAQQQQQQQQQLVASAVVTGSVASMTGNKRTVEGRLRTQAEAAMPYDTLQADLIRECTNPDGTLNEAQLEAAQNSASTEVLAAARRYLVDEGDPQNERLLTWEELTEELRNGKIASVEDYEALSAVRAERWLRKNSQRPSEQDVQAMLARANKAMSNKRSQDQELLKKLSSKLNEYTSARGGLRPPMAMFFDFTSNETTGDWARNWLLEQGVRDGDEALELDGSDKEDALDDERSVARFEREADAPPSLVALEPYKRFMEYSAQRAVLTQMVKAGPTNADDLDDQRNALYERMLQVASELKAAVDAMADRAEAATIAKARAYSEVMKLLGIVPGGWDALAAALEDETDGVDGNGENEEHYKYERMMLFEFPESVRVSQPRIKRKMNNLFNKKLLDPERRSRRRELWERLEYQLRQMEDEAFVAANNAQLRYNRVVEQLAVLRPALSDAADAAEAAKTRLASDKASGNEQLVLAAKHAMSQAEHRLQGLVDDVARLEEREAFTKADMKARRQQWKGYKGGVEGGTSQQASERQRIEEADKKAMEEHFNPPHLRGPQTEMARGTQEQQAEFLLGRKVMRARLKIDNEIDPATGDASKEGMYQRLRRALYEQRKIVDIDVEEAIDAYVREIDEEHEEYTRELSGKLKKLQKRMDELDSAHLFKALTMLCNSQKKDLITRLREMKTGKDMSAEWVNLTLAEEKRLRDGAEALRGKLSEAQAALAAQAAVKEKYDETKQRAAELYRRKQRYEADWQARTDQQRPTRGTREDALKALEEEGDKVMAELRVFVAENGPKWMDDAAAFASDDPTGPSPDADRGELVAAYDALKQTLDGRRAEVKAVEKKLERWAVLRDHSAQFTVEAEKHQKQLLADLIKARGTMPGARRKVHVGAPQEMENLKRARDTVLNYLQASGDLVQVHGWYVIAKRRAQEPYNLGVGEKQKLREYDTVKVPGKALKKENSRLRAWAADEKVTDFRWMTWKPQDSLPKLALKAGGYGLGGEVAATYIEPVLRARRHMASILNLKKRIGRLFEKMMAAVGPKHPEVMRVQRLLDVTYKEDMALARGKTSAKVGFFSSSAEHKTSLAAIEQKASNVYTKDVAVRTAHFNAVQRTRTYQKGRSGGGRERAEEDAEPLDARDPAAELVATAVGEMMQLGIAQGPRALHYLSGVCKIVARIQRWESTGLHDEVESADGEDEEEEERTIVLGEPDISDEALDLNPGSVLAALTGGDSRARQPHIAWKLVRRNSRYAKEWHELVALVDRWNALPPQLRGGSMVRRSEAKTYLTPSFCRVDASNQLPIFVAFDAEASEGDDAALGEIFVVTQQDQAARAGLAAARDQRDIDAEEYEARTRGVEFRTPIATVECGDANVPIDATTKPILRQPFPMDPRGIVRKATMHQPRSELVDVWVQKAQVEQGRVAQGEEYAQLQLRVEQEYDQRGITLTRASVAEVVECVAASVPMQKARELALRREHALRQGVANAYAKKKKLAEELWQLQTMNTVGVMRLDPSQLAGPSSTMDVEVREQIPVAVAGMKDAKKLEEMQQQSVYKDDASTIRAARLQYELEEVDKLYQSMVREMAVMSAQPALDSAFLEIEDESAFVSSVAPTDADAYNRTGAWLDNPDRFIEGRRVIGAVRWAVFMFDYFMRTYYWWASATCPAPSTFTVAKERYAYLKKLVQWAKQLKVGRRTYLRLPLWIIDTEQEPPEGDAAFDDYEFEIAKVTCGGNTLVLGPAPDGACPDDATLGLGGGLGRYRYIPMAEGTAAAARTTRRDQSVVRLEEGAKQYRQAAARLLGPVQQYGMAPRVNYADTLFSDIKRFIQEHPDWEGTPEGNYARAPIEQYGEKIYDAYYVQATYVDRSNVPKTLPSVNLHRFVSRMCYNEEALLLVDAALTSLTAPLMHPRIVGQLEVRFQATGKKIVFSNLPAGVTPAVLADRAEARGNNNDEAGPSSAFAAARPSQLRDPMLERHLDPGAALRLPPLPPLPAQ